MVSKVFRLSRSLSPVTITSVSRERSSKNRQVIRITTRIGSNLNRCDDNARIANRINRLTDHHVRHFDFVEKASLKFVEDVIGSGDGKRAIKTRADEFERKVLREK